MYVTITNEAPKRAYPDDYFTVGNKREVKPFLKKVLEADVTLTNKFCSWANNISALRTIKNHAKMLEVSCHGLPWFVLVLAWMWVTRNGEVQHVLINLLFGLVLDLIFVSFLKAGTRRRRPAENKKDAFMMVGADKFSFPSGHASRAMFLALFFMYLWPISVFVIPPLCAWATSVAISRVLMRRHHILDVICGLLLGFVTAFILNILWISASWSRYIYSYISDEVMEGASYDV
ncbi:hypothetical protein B566_EDAN011956 [Ephemera danica]|nr:hypothetical protein B566_EDAN011956 [Ephemera danica]